MSTSTLQSSVTESAGPFVVSNNTVQPILGLNYLVVDQGTFPSREGGGADGTFIGEVVMFAGAIPIGVSAGGQLLSISQNTALFSLLGTNYGGNGQTTFALPNLRGRIAVGQGNGPGLSPRSLGNLVGSEQIGVTYPAHSHTISGTTTDTVSTPINVSNVQPELSVNYIIALSGVFPSRSEGFFSAGSDPFIGEVALFAGNFAPAGWAFAQGQLLPISQNTALFSILGNTYGGDGKSTFALPDLRGRAAIGAGAGPGLSPYTLGQTGGSETIVETPSHSHGISQNTTTAAVANPVSYSNLQPFNTLNYIVSLNGIFPLSERSVPDEQFIGEVRLFAGNFAPAGWALANGQLLSIDQNEALFVLLGTAYGGDGQTTFALPDLRGRTPVNIGAGVGLTNWRLGQPGGTETENLTWPNHTHLILDSTAPVLASITRQSPTSEITNAGILVFRLTFSEAVQTVDASDFVLQGGNGASVAVQSVSSSVYDLIVFGNELTSYTGRLSLAIDGDSTIVDLAGNVLSVAQPDVNESFTVVNGAVFNFEQFVQFEAINNAVFPAFDEDLYLLANPDVKAAVDNGFLASGLQHYSQYGQVEGRSVLPLDLSVGGLKLSAFFDETYYLSQNLDVASAVAQGAFAYGFEHFLRFGLAEGRNPSSYYSEAFYLANNPDIQAAVSAGSFGSGLEHYVQFGHRENRIASTLFNPTDYLLQNPDVKAAVDSGAFASGFAHYLRLGASEGRVHTLLYEENNYLAQNPDVAGALASDRLTSGFEHYVAFGQREGRNPGPLFNESAYIAANLDVAEAVNADGFSSGMEHFFRFGRAEGRLLG